MFGLIRNLKRPGGSLTGRGPSLNLWSKCPVMEYLVDPTKGMVYFNDFQGDNAMADNTAVTHLGNNLCGFVGNGTASSITSLTTDPNGVCVLTSDTDNITVGISALGSLNTAGQFVFTAGKKSWFEARIKSSTITDTKHGIFVGFAEEGLLSEGGIIADDGTITDKDLVGFHRLEGDGDKLDILHNTASGGGVTSLKTDAITLVADTWIKVGIYCDGTTVYFYSNGAPLSTTVALSATNFPDREEMAFYMTVSPATSTTPGTSSIDWVRIAREF